MIKQTAGREALGEFAPKFAHYNDDILFGENWNDDSIDLKTRCIITVVALMSSNGSRRDQRGRRHQRLPGCVSVPG